MNLIHFFVARRRPFSLVVRRFFSRQFCRQCISFLLLLFFVLMVTFTTILQLRNFNFTKQLRLLPLCRDGDGHGQHASLALHYQLHSLAAWPCPAPAPLNWLDLQLLLSPSAALLCQQNHSFSHPQFNGNNERNGRNLPPMAPLSHMFLAIVHSHRQHRDRRAALRLQFAQNGLAGAAIFVLSAANASREELDMLREESRANGGDLLVLANVEERYRLLVHKTRAWIEWLMNQQRKCSSPFRRPRFLLKIDDDVHVNWSALGRLLQRAGPKPKRIVLCRTIVGGQITRNPASKWFLSSREFRSRPQGLGLYCQGLALLLSWDLLRTAAENLRKVQFLWMDDWYLTHALLAGSNATFVDIAPHVRNVDLSEQISMSITTKTAIPIGISRNVHYPAIFGHFRPAENFSPKRRLAEWKRMLEEEEVEEKEDVKGSISNKCSL